MWEKGTDLSLLSSSSSLDALSNDPAVSPLSADAIVKFCEQCLKALFQVEFAVVTPFVLDTTTAVARSLAELPVDVYEFESWLFQHAQARDELKSLELLHVQRDSLFAMRAAQQPYTSGDAWLGGAGLDSVTPDSECYMFVGDVDPLQMVGLVLHSFDEQIPGVEHDAGLGFHFDQSSTEPPHTWLLAVPPDMPSEGDFWDPDTLFDIIAEASDLARIRLFVF